LTGETLPTKPFAKPQPIVGDVKYGQPTWGDYAWRQLVSKTHPGVVFGVTFAPGVLKRMPWVPERIQKRFHAVNLIGNETSLQTEAGKYVGPITYADIWQAMHAQDIPTGTAMSILAFLGEGLQTYNQQPGKVNFKKPF
jgi:hypothetical protein